MDSQRWLTYDVFAPLLGQEFTALARGGESVPLVLVAADGSEWPGGAGADGQARTQFSIVFRGPTQRRLEQGTHAFTSTTVGDFDLFVVPIRADGEGVYYEAVFG